MLKRVVWAIALLVVVSSAALAVACSGAYDVAADEPHWSLTSRVMATVRDRSIAVRAADLTVPNLADSALIALGAEHYAAMCTGCHLAPGTGDNAMRQGLYPKPPNLRRSGRPWHSRSSRSSGKSSRRCYRVGDCFGSAVPVRLIELRTYRLHQMSIRAARS